jgi:hypothetical protein
MMKVVSACEAVRLIPPETLSLSVIGFAGQLIRELADVYKRAIDRDLARTNLWR